MNDQSQSFDDRYAALRSQAHTGWGGSRYQRRFSDWSSAIARLQERVALPFSAMKVVELGCGNGMASYVLAAQGAGQVHGIDFSETAIAWAQQRFLDASLSADLRVGHVCQMPFYADEMFDLVIDGNCLHCIIGEDRSRFLAEALRITRKKGFCLISSMCGPPTSREAIQNYDPGVRCLTEDGRSVRYLPSPESLVQECLAAGFEFVAADLSNNEWWDHLELLLVRPEFEHA